jgi:hypothetical protein
MLDGVSRGNKSQKINDKTGETARELSWAY